MATTTVKETFPKATTKREEVEAERQLKLGRPGVVSSVITEEGTNFVLTTVLQVVGADAKGAEEKDAEKRKADKSVPKPATGGGQELGAKSDKGKKP